MKKPCPLHCIMQFPSGSGGKLGQLGDPVTAHECHPYAGSPNVPSYARSVTPHTHNKTSLCQNPKVLLLPTCTPQSSQARQIPRQHFLTQHREVSGAFQFLTIPGHQSKEMHHDSLLSLPTPPSLQPELGKLSQKPTGRTTVCLNYLVLQPLGLHFQGSPVIELKVPAPH